MALGLATTLGAQRTWIVDWRNGPGTNFTDLPPALTAANDGDLVLVRGPGGPGLYRSAYTGGQTSRGITLLGLDSPQLKTPSGSNYVMEVTGVPAGRTFMMKGFELDGDGFASRIGGIRVAACQGRILLDEVGYNAQLANQLEIAGCTNVTVNRCKFGSLPGTIAGASGLSCTQSVVALTETSVGGAPAVGSYYHGSCNGSLAPSVPAVTSIGSVLTIAGGLVLGGEGLACATQVFPATPAIQQIGGVLMLTGDLQTQVRAGVTTPGPAIQSDSGIVLRDADVQIVPTMTSPPIVGSSQVSLFETPYLRGAGLPAGYTVPMGLFGQSGDGAILLGSFPGAPVQVPPWGVWWLSPGAFVIATTVIGTNRQWQLNLPVPAGTPDGVALAFQGATANLVGVALSNPLVLVLH